MGDADILAKLSRILETHHLSNDEEENTSIEEILHNISIEAGIRVEDEQEQDKTMYFFHSLVVLVVLAFVLMIIDNAGDKILNITRSQHLMKCGKQDKMKNS